MSLLTTLPAVKDLDLLEDDFDGCKIGLGTHFPRVAAQTSHQLVIVIVILLQP